MDTTTGLTSLQETLQTDRWLVTDAAEPATVPFSDVKPPPLAAHPFAAMVAALGRPVPPEPLAAAAPADFYFVRFKSLTHLFQLRDQLDSGVGPVLPVLDGRFDDYDVAGRYETALGVKQTALTRFLGPPVVQDLAIVGSDPYLREGSDLTLIFRVKPAAAFEAGAGRNAGPAGHPPRGLSPSTVTRDRDPDPHHPLRRRGRGPASGLGRRVRDRLQQPGRHRARAGRHCQARAARGRTADFRYMLARDAAVPADVLAFMSDRFVAEVAGPRQKILEARRQLAAAELVRPGYAALLHGWLYGAPPDSADALVTSGLLKRAELSHAGGEPIDWQPGRAAHSSWGRVGALTPLIDLPPPDRVTPTERDAYAMFVATYQSYWRAYIDPIAARIALGAQPGASIGFDLRILPIIAGSDYSEVSRTVGRARIALPVGRRGLPHRAGDRTRRRAAPPVVSVAARAAAGGRAQDRLAGRLGAAGDGRHAAEAHDRARKAGVDVADRSAAAESGRAAALRRHRDPRPRARRGVSGRRPPGDRASGARCHRLARGRQGARRALRGHPRRRRLGRGQERLARSVALLLFCKSSLLLSLSETALRHHIDECVDGSAPRALTADGAEGPQWIVESDLRERGPAWWWLVYQVAEQGSHLDSAGSRATIALAEAVLRGAPRISPAAARALGRQTFRGRAGDARGRDYLLADDGLQDPVRGLLAGTRVPALDLIADPDSPLVRLLRLIGHARSEISFDDEPTTASGRAPQPARPVAARRTTTVPLGAARMARNNGRQARSDRR